MSEVLFECKIISRNLLTSLHQQLNEFTLLSFCHNYYPKPTYALLLYLLEEKSSLIYQFNPRNKTQWFIVRSGLRGPLHKGLPTIEANET